MTLSQFSEFRTLLAYSRGTAYDAQGKFVHEYGMTKAPGKTSGGASTTMSGGVSTTP